MTHVLQHLSDDFNWCTLNGTFEKRKSNMNRICSLIVLSLCAMLTCASAQAELYSWKDSSGKTIFSDRPPLDSEKNVATESGGKSAKNTGDKGDDPRTALRREEAKKKKMQDDDKKLIKWRCAELDKEYQALLAAYEEQVKTDAKKAAALKVDADNHKDTIDKLCN